MTFDELFKDLALTQEERTKLVQHLAMMRAVKTMTLAAQPAAPTEVSRKTTREEKIVRPGVYEVPAPIVPAPEQVQQHRCRHQGEAVTYPIRTFNYARIVNVVDGDTCDIELDLGFGIKIKQRFRLAHIDTPERGMPGWKEARDYLITVMGAPITVKSTKLDKYGRYLADIFVFNVSVNQEMMRLGLAVAIWRWA